MMRRRRMMMRMMMRMKRRRRRQTKIKGTNRGNKGQKIIRMWTWIEAQICIWPQISSTIKVRQNTNSSKMPRFCKLPKQPCKITCLWPWHGRGCWAAIAFNAFGGHRTGIPRWKSCFHRLGAFPVKEVGLKTHWASIEIVTENGESVKFNRTRNGKHGNM